MTAPSPRLASRLAVIIPCRNEAPTIACVVSAFRAALSDAAITVFDNNSTDGTDAAPHAAAPAMVRQLLDQRLDMVTGIRIAADGA